MKWIDFDELEKLKDTEDSEKLEEGWDGNFFAEFADKVSEPSEDEEDIYLSVPAGEQEKADKEIDEDAYISVPQELSEVSPEETYQKKLKEKADKDRYVIEKEEEDIYTAIEEMPEMSLEEKRVSFGRMLGLRVPKDAEIVSENADEVAKNAEEMQESQTEMPKDAEESFWQEDLVIEESDYEEFEDSEQEEAVYYNPFEYDKETTDEYREFKEEYIRKNILELEEEAKEESEENTDEEKRIEEKSEEKQIEEKREEEKSEEKQIEEKREEKPEEKEPEEVFKEQQDEKQECPDVLNDFLDEVSRRNGIEESSFVDEQEFERIEQEEQKKLLNREKEEEAEEYTEIISEFADEFPEELEETDVKTDEEEPQLKMESEEQGLKVESEEPQFKTESEEPKLTVESKLTTEQKAKVLNIRDIQHQDKSVVKPVEGVLQKRSLPGRSARDIDKARERYLTGGNFPKENAGEMPQEIEGAVTADTDKSVKKASGKKIKKLQSAFENEYLEILDEGVFEVKGGERKKADIKKPNKTHKVSWEDEEETPDRPFREFIGLLISIAVVVLVTFVLVEFVGQRTEVNGESMEMTLQDGDNLIVDKISYAFHEPERFDIIVFPYRTVNSDEDVYYIKRIIGLPGEKVQIINGFIYINGEVLVESYGKNNNLILNPGRAEKEILLGEDEYFVLGDNRNNSSDSREIGNIKREDIVGRAWLRIWPLSDFGILKHQ